MEGLEASLQALSSPKQGFMPQNLRSEMKVSRVRLFATPWMVAHLLLCPWDKPGKNTEWVAIRFSSGSSLIQIWVSCIAGRFFTIRVTREAQNKANQINPGQGSSIDTAQNLKLSGCGNTALTALDRLPNLSEPLSLPVTAVVKEGENLSPASAYHSILISPKLRDTADLLNYLWGLKMVFANASATRIVIYKVLLYRRLNP